MTGRLTPAAQGRTVWTEVRIGSAWKKQRTGTTSATGRFSIPLTYGKGHVHTYVFRVAYRTADAHTIVSSQVTLKRTAVLNLVRRAAKRSDVPKSYRAGCPVGPSSLTYVAMNYWGFDGDIHRGSLVVRASRATRMTRGFDAGFRARFPLRRMHDPSIYNNSDPVSMRKNNTYAFSCRRVTGNPYRLSPHAYGSAVDVNPYQNPYRVNGRWYPSTAYVDRSPTRAGMLTSRSAFTKAMKSNGFRWFSGWDWQHFQP